MSSVDVGMDGLRVMVGIPAGRDFHPYVVKSLIGTIEACHRLNIHCGIGMVANSAVIQWARDEVLDQFIGSDANRLFWIDSDMVWEPAQFIRLLAMSKLRDVVCATYPAKIDSQPTYFVKYDKAKGLVYDEYGLVEIEGVGLGFTVMTREVAEAVTAASDKIMDEVTGKEMASVFTVGSINGNRRGEDMAFFNMIRECGFKVHLDPSIDLGHIGTKVYRGKFTDAFKTAG